MQRLVFGSYSFTLLVGALNGAVVALLLWRTRRTANRLLAALVLVVALRLVPYIIGYAGFYDAYPWLSFAPFDLPLAMGPLLWLYVERLTTGAMPPRWRWHLAPAIVHGAAWFLVFALCTVPQKNWIDTHVVRWLGPIIIALSQLGLAVYSAAALRRYRAYQQWLDDEFSDRDAFRLTWLRLLILLFAATAVVWLGFSVTHWAIVPLDYFDVFPLYVWLAALSYALGLLAWRGTAVAYPVPSTHGAPADDAPASSFAAAPAVDADVSPIEGDDAPEPDGRRAIDWAALGQRYAERMESEEWWRDPGITLPVLARRLDTNTAYLSRALNVGLGVNFNRFVNRYRAEAVAAALRDGSTRDLLQLAFDAGFNSKASFQRAFREHLGESPSAYRERTGVGSASPTPAE